MTEIAGILWLRPWWLLAVPAALLIMAVLARRATGLGAWERAADPELLDRMRAMGRVSRGGRFGNWAVAALVALAGIALAGPAVERRDAASWRNLDAVLLLVDLSPSVTEADRLIDTLAMARLVAAAAGTRQTGLIAYAGEAYLAAPVSTDARAIGGTISLLDGETLPVNGSRPETALTRAARVIAGTRLLSAEVVLLSDGGGLGPEAIASASRLADAGAAVSTLHVDTGAGGAAEMAALARAGGGASGTLAAPGPVLERLSAARADRLAETGYAMLVLEDLGRWLLAVAMIPALLLLPRREGA